MCRADRKREGPFSMPPTFAGLTSAASLFEIGHRARDRGRWWWKISRAASSDHQERGGDGYHLTSVYSVSGERLVQVLGEQIHNLDPIIVGDPQKRASRYRATTKLMGGTVDLAGTDRDAGRCGSAVETAA